MLSQHMIHMPYPSQFQSSHRNVPRRVDSLKPPVIKNPYFTELDDELRDIRRVHSQGQEEDLRYALGRTLNRIEELTSMLKEAYKTQTDLQTELTLAKSNLQLALANNEMLEDALKRDPHGKDVGWRRMSAREQSLKAEAEADRRRSTESLTSTEFSASPTLSQPSPAPDYHSPITPRSAVPSPAPATENRFFRFRFGNGSAAPSSSHPSSPRLSAGQSPVLLNGSHLTSASLPSLVNPRDWEKEVDELNHQLEAERKAHKKATEDKTALEGELESLSQALFEEANKMVATERRKLAETEEALREAREQGEALKNVLRLFERNNAPNPPRSSTETAIEPAQTRSRHRASSSAVGIKAPSSGIPSPTSESNSPALPSIELPVSARTITFEPVAATLSEEASESAPPLSESPTESAPVASISNDPPRSSLSTTVDTTTSSSSSPSPSPSPVPSPVSGPDQFLFAASRDVNYFDGEESPWADATSAASPRAVT